MLVFIIIIALICLTFMVELMYGIFHFNYNTRPIDFIKLRGNALECKRDYGLYKSTGDKLYLERAKKCVKELEKYMDVYDVRFFYGVDLIDVQKN